MHNQTYHIVCLDDDEDFLRSMSLALTSRLDFDKEVEVEVHFISDPFEGLSFTNELVNEQEKIAVIISDQQMPKMTGIEFMEKSRETVPNAIRVLLTGHASLESAKYAINNQILDQYVSKPIDDYENFTSIIKNAVKTFHFREEKKQADEKIRQYITELEDTNERIRSMHHAAEKIAYLAQGFRKLDLDEVLDMIIEKLPTIFKAKYASLFLLSDDGNSLQMVKSNHLTKAYKKRMTVDDQSPMMVAIRENKIIVLPEIDQAPYDFLKKKDLGCSCIIIPFIIGRQQDPTDILGNNEGIKGVLNMSNITDMEDEDVVEYAAALIRNILGINILNARLYQMTQRLALIDGLTGLYNKHIFMEFLRKECEYSERHGIPFSLSIIDVDDFKVINDTHGHRIGDEVLKRLGLILNGASRKSDIVARFGGEEFVWLIHRGEVHNIIEILERLRTEIYKHIFPNSIRLTVSIGVTRFYTDGKDTIERLFDRADKALYQPRITAKIRQRYF